MLWDASKRLLSRYGGTCLYVTDIIYSSNREPERLYIYLPGTHAEMEIEVGLILKKIKNRSRNETLFLLQVDTTLTLLLVLDDKRGNHFVYCTPDVFGKLFFHMETVTALSQTATAELPRPEDLIEEPAGRDSDHEDSQNVHIAAPLSQNLPTRASRHSNRSPQPHSVKRITRWIISLFIFFHKII